MNKSWMYAATAAAAGIVIGSLVIFGAKWAYAKYLASQASTTAGV